MSEQVLKKSGTVRKRQKSKVRTIAQVAMFGSCGNSVDVV